MAQGFRPKRMNRLHEIRVARQWLRQDRANGGREFEDEEVPQLGARAIAIVQGRRTNQFAKKPVYYLTVMSLSLE